MSLLPSISKIIERVAYNQLYNYFTTNNLFYNYQYGFRTNHSTELAALHLTNQILSDMDKNLTPLNIYLDLSKAFDTLNHKIPLQKLQYYGIKNNELSFFKDYLSGRSQYVDCDGNISNLLPILTGVPRVPFSVHCSS